MAAGVARFMGRYILLGLGIAIAVIWFAPELVTSQRPVVEVREAPRAASSEPSPHSYARAVERAAPAVVNVHTAKPSSEPRHPFFDEPLFDRFSDDESPRQPKTETSLGSGVLVSNKGHILTNHHVIEGATAIQVQLTNGRRASAELVGTDPETDLAVLRIAIDNLPSITTGQSRDLAVGDVVLAIGNPFGVGQTVTQGIVSATGRSQLGLTTFEDFIQTDAAINPGNSGGALVNADGELIGINTAIYSRSGGSMGIGFAIPVDMAKRVMDDIVENGEVIRGWLGIQVQPVTEELADAFDLADTQGLLVASVHGRGPAAATDIRAGDILTALNGEPIQGARKLRRRVTALSPGDTAALKLLRDGEKLRREVTVARRPSREAPAKRPTQ